jgi:hypothetical protein
MLSAAYGSVEASSDRSSGPANTPTSNAAVVPGAAVTASLVRSVKSTRSGAPRNVDSPACACTMPIAGATARDVEPGGA